MHGWLSVGSPVSTPHRRHRRESHMLLSVGAEKASHKTPPSVTLDTLERGMQGDFLSVGQATCGPAADTCSGEGARGLPRDRDKTCWRCLSAESRGFWPERAIAPERSNRPGTREGRAELRVHSGAVSRVGSSSLPHNTRPSALTGSGRRRDTNHTEIVQKSTRLSDEGHNSL